MKMEVTSRTEDHYSKVKLVLGAASLFFFVIGLKRSFRTEDGGEVLGDAEESARQRDPERTTGPVIPNKRLRNAG